MVINGFIRTGVAVPPVHLADVAANTAEHLIFIRRAAEQGVSVLLFPELSLTGYTCADLFRSRLLLDATRSALSELAAATAGLPMLIAAGAPVEYGGALYNCAVFLADGEIKAIVPKSYLPNYQEFYERRWFQPAAGKNGSVSIDGRDIPFGTDILIRFGHALVAAEICEDLWVPVPPSCRAATAGANIIVNLSATDELIGKHAYLRSLIAQQSARCRCAYLYASAGEGESSTDLVYTGNAIIATNGSILREAPRFHATGSLETADIDLENLDNDRRTTGTFADCAADCASGFRIIESGLLPLPVDHIGLRAEIDPHPFVPADQQRRDYHCEEILTIQSAGLAQRLRATGCRSLTVGISGGLDSTLALLVAVKAFDSLGLPRKGINGITMPGFGTTGRTHSNSLKLMERLGVNSVEIPIGEAVRLHFRDIGHDGVTTDVTYENSQARMRTLILMNYANRTGGMVLGTGDLSELALGWCTYNGDQMSMYGVNASVPKTLVRHLVSHYARTSGDGQLAEALLDIIDTPISPELLPHDADGSIAQKTEDLVGPYELHDFFLYHTLRFGSSPRKIYALALNAFEGTYDADVIKHWLDNFYRRFFTQQFKRSCMPDGPKTGSVCLSPRGDWRMPSDASSAQWRKEISEL